MTCSSLGVCVVNVVCHIPSSRSLLPGGKTNSRVETRSRLRTASPCGIGANTTQEAEGYRRQWENLRLAWVRLPNPRDEQQGKPRSSKRQQH